MIKLINTIPKDTNFNSQDKEYTYTISGTFEFEVNATNEEEAMEKVNDELRLENINYNIWGGECSKLYINKI
tara:strand:- start:230 stop:445 length:216 start_codon:yes stop_codon:yes gene_type:complete